MSVAARVSKATGARSATRVHSVQELWSGWGEIARYALEDGPVETVIVKQVQPPADGAHPRGWDSDRSDRRKRQSYSVERAFYQSYAPSLPPDARVARTWALAEGFFVLEDLDAAGFPGRARGALPPAQILLCLRWLASLHATFLGCPVRGLWPRGTYWHLQTRPDELERMAEGRLKRGADALDQALSRSVYTTVLHGDAKLANVCFSPARDAVAVVDFQYAGGGIGVQDVAYFLGSCLGDGGLRASSAALLDAYFEAFRGALITRDGDSAVGLGEAVEREWRGLWPVAWADFERFLAGWAPSHSKRTGFAAELTAQALDLVESGPIPE